MPHDRVPQKLLRLSLIILLAPLLAAGAGLAHAGWVDGMLDGLRSELSGARTPNEAELVRGIRQALEVATSRSVARVGRPGGYWKNPEIRIPLPERLRKPADLLRRMGFGRTVEDLERRMNRAAEAAAPKAKPIFVDAVRGLRLRDVRAIWKGPEDAATRYFRRHTEARLIEVFRPIVHRELEHAGAVRAWRAFADRFRSLPLVGHRLKDDLDGYVTRKALDGLFAMLAREEARIRKDPAARTTELLKRVFG